MMLDFCQLRDRCGLGLADVAAEFGEPLDAVFRWENGEASPPDRVLRSLSIMADFSGRAATANHGVALLERPEVLPRTEPATPRQRKSQLGQFMTPQGVAEFMASLFELQSKSAIRVLDAGAGQGALTAAFIKRVQGTARIAATAFEFDDQILLDLRANLATLGQRANATSRW